MTKGRTAFTTLTASGTTSNLDCSGAVETTLLLKHSNGTGTISAPATFTISVQANGGSAWYVLTTLPASSTAAQTDDLVIPIPGPSASVRVAYTVPTGATSPSLAGEIATLSL